MGTCMQKLSEWKWSEYEYDNHFVWGHRVSDSIVFSWLLVWATIYACGGYPSCWTCTQQPLVKNIASVRWHLFVVSHVFGVLIRCRIYDAHKYTQESRMVRCARAGHGVPRRNSDMLSVCVLLISALKVLPWSGACCGACTLPFDFPLCKKWPLCAAAEHLSVMIHDCDRNCCFALILHRFFLCLCIFYILTICWLFAVVCNLNIFTF